MWQECKTGQSAVMATAPPQLSPAKALCADLRLASRACFEVEPDASETSLKTDFARPWRTGAKFSLHCSQSFAPSAAAIGAQLNDDPSCPATVVWQGEQYTVLPDCPTQAVNVPHWFEGAWGRDAAWPVLAGDYNELCTCAPVSRCRYWYVAAQDGSPATLLFNSKLQSELN